MKAVPIVVGFSMGFLLSFNVLAAQPVVPGSNVEDVPEAQKIRGLIHQSESTVDFAKAKLAFDRIIDPTIDIESNLAQIDAMTSKIRLMAGMSASSDEKLNALRTYLYQPGHWNENRPFRYDLDDPLGSRIHNKLLPTYLATRRGNCVSMPILFLILGRRLGLDVTLARAPEHIFIKYRGSATEPYINLETTSGALPARDVWIRKQMPMTDEALANHLYMVPLNNREILAVMALVVADYLSDKQELEKALAVTDVVLSASPKEVESMVRKGSLYVRLIKRDFARRYPSPNLIPDDQQPYFRFLDAQHRQWYTKAETLGWRVPSQETNDQLLQTAQRDKIKQLGGNP